MYLGGRRRSTDARRWAGMTQQSAECCLGASAKATRYDAHATSQPLVMSPASQRRRVKEDEGYSDDDEDYEFQSLPCCDLRRTQCVWLM